MAKNQKQFSTLAIDIETECTQGCDTKCDHALDPFKSRITCIGVYDDTTSLVFRDLVRFNNFITELGPDVKLIGHNFKFDIKHLYFNGIDLREYWGYDTQLMAASFTKKVPDAYVEAYEARRQLENKKLPPGFSHRKAGGYSLKVLAPYFLGVSAFWEDPSNHDNDEYVLKDCEYTYRLYKYFKTKLRENDTYSFCQERLMPWARMLLNSELKGIAIDLDLTLQLEKETLQLVEDSKVKLDSLWQLAYKIYFEGKRQALETNYRLKFEIAIKKTKNKKKCKDRYLKLYLAAVTKLPKKMNLGSWQQLLWILQDHFKLNMTNSKGKPGTDEGVIQRLIHETGRGDLKLLLKYREQQKLLGTYLKPYQQLQHEGTIHCNYNVTGTRTGRITASDPNLQNVPPIIHQLFKARPGKKLATFDMSQIEARLIAYYSEDTVLTQLITSGQDFHGFNASIYFPYINCKVNEVKEKFPAERQFAKTLGYALFYGAGTGRVQETSRKSGYHWTKERSKTAVQDFRDTYQGVIEYKERLDKEVVEFDGVRNLFGRKHAFENPDDIYMKNFNTLIQGAASDMVLESGRRINEREGFDVLLFVHDELVIEFDNDIDVYFARAWIVHCMTDYELSNSIGSIPLKVEGRIGDTWLK